jgi:energy-coupling factor transporter transmembrane protein EcfT
MAAASITIHGIDGVFLILAALLFLVATIIAALPPRNYWAAAIGAGLLFWLLTLLVHS